MRKNLRGLHSHLQRLTDRLVREEFPALGPVRVSTYVFQKVSDTALAHWFQCSGFTPDLVHREICFNMHQARDYFLTATDEEIRDTIRHELLHGELRRQGQAHGDNDLPFIMECLRRGIIVNDESVKKFKKHYGRGSFEFFRHHLPAHETHVMLANGGGYRI